MLNYVRVVFDGFKARIKKEDGMELLQVILIAGLLLVIIVIVFYPAVKDFFGVMMKAITDWWSAKGSDAFK